MILSTLSEEQILSELIIDYKRVKRIAKKNADASITEGRFSCYNKRTVPPLQVVIEQRIRERLLSCSL